MLTLFEIIERIDNMSKEMKMRLLPWVLLFGGFLSLSILPPVVGGFCMIIGFVMLIDRRWPEQWGTKDTK